MAIYAWRWWQIPRRSLIHPKLLLRGVLGVEWPVGQSLQAECHKIDPIASNRSPQYYISSRHYYGGNEPPDNRTPVVNCRCGIYALKDPVDSINVFLGRERDRSHVVLGVVEIWGKIICAELGYRAEFGQIRAVVDAPNKVSTVYGIPNLPSIEYAQREYFNDQALTEKG
jgi:hypothetical protein